MSEKVLVVGFDGATFDIIKPLVADGRLPTLANIMKNGAWGTLQSTIPPVTPLAWTSVFTGKNGGKHGILDFQEINPETYDFTPVRTDRHREKTIWQLLGEVGKRSIVMDVPFTYPPRPLNGLMLTGYGTPRTPDTVFTYPQDFTAVLPPELHSEIRVALPTHKFDRSQAFIDEWGKVMSSRGKLLNHLITEEDWDFFMVVFSITDNMGHVFWTYVDPAHPNYSHPEAQTYRDAFLHSYEQCDRLLGELIEKAGSDTTTLIVSDHGFGSVRPRQYIYQRLLEGGFITLKNTTGSVPLKAQLAKTAVKTYNRFPFLREWAKGLRPGNRKALKKSLKQTGIMPTASSVDYSKSKIIPSNFGLCMWVNDNKRFAQGIVPPTKVESILEELSAFLLADRDKATNEPIVTETIRAHTLYTGPYTDLMPDLVINYNNLYKPEQQPNGNNPFVEGGHTLDGIFLAHGRHIQPGQISKATLIDLAPTILHLSHQPIPPDMDGRVLTAILNPEFQEKHPVKTGETPAQFTEEDVTIQNTFSDDEDAEIKEQLRQLGYIE